MNFSRYREEALRSIRRMTLAYGLAVIAVVLIFNVAAVALWWGLFRGASLPVGFVIVNTLATGGLIVGGTWLETSRLSHDSGSLAERLGARELAPGASGSSLLERRTINVLEEIALAARLPIPRLFVLDNDESINALVLGMRREDATVVLTRGAIDRLTRSELQGVVGHEMAHLLNGDVLVHTRLAAMNYGLEMVANLGRFILGGMTSHRQFGKSGRENGDGRALFFLPGVLLLLIGSAGHLAALLLTAAMGRTRELHADALAVRLTRHPKALGNALRKVVWLNRTGALPPGVPAALQGLQHAMFLQPGGDAQTWLKSAWFDTHPPIADRIGRLLGRTAAREIHGLVAERGEADDRDLSEDLTRSARWLARSALPPLACSVEADAGGVVTVTGVVTATAVPAAAASAAAASAAAASSAARAGELPALEMTAAPPAPPAGSAHLVALVAATRDAHDAAALCALLILGAGQEPEAWPNRWRAAQDRQNGIAERLIALGPSAVEGLRWPLLEMCAATLKPLAEPWRDELLRMLRGQIELDNRVTLSEWIYYMLLRARLMPQRESAWRGDENAANPSEAVRWVVSLLGSVSGEPALRGERLANDLIRELGLNRTGQSHPPLDIGGLQATVAELRRLPIMRRPLLMRQLVAFLSPDAPVEARDFIRVLALIIDCPMPAFAPLQMVTPDASRMPTELTLTRRLSESPA